MMLQKWEQAGQRAIQNVVRHAIPVFGFERAVWRNLLRHTSSFENASGKLIRKSFPDLTRSQVERHSGFAREDTCAVRLRKCLGLQTGWRVTSSSFCSIRLREGRPATHRGFQIEF